LLQHSAPSPPLQLPPRPRLHHRHRIADLDGVGLVVSVEVLPAPVDRWVEGVADRLGDLHHHGLVHAVGGHDAQAHLTLRSFLNLFLPPNLVRGAPGIAHCSSSTSSADSSDASVASSSPVSPASASSARPRRRPRRRLGASASSSSFSRSRRRRERSTSSGCGSLPMPSSRSRWIERSRATSFRS